MNNYNWNDAFPNTPKNFKSKVSMTLNSLPDEREQGIMKGKMIKSKIMVALVATMILGTTAFAGGKVISINSSSSNIPTYTKMPTAEKINNDFGFNPKLVEKFENGYAFTGGYVVNNEGKDEQGNSIMKTKSLDFDYEKGDDKIGFYMENKEIDEETEKKQAVDTYKNVELYYNSYDNKVVPGDYEMTEEDEKDKLSGKYVFSFGSDDVRISKVQGLSWKENGIRYGFITIDSEISQDELVEMAHQVIDSK